MKTVLAILLVIGTLSLASAQNYQLIQPNQEAHFNYKDLSLVSSVPILQSIRIDSMATLGSDIYYHNHQILSQTSYTGSCQITINDSSWIGHQIIARPNGDYVFFNRSNDSILIKTTANINNTWTLYTFPNNDYIEASVMAVIDTTILGTMDSVKTIVLQVKDNANNPISHPFNNKQIKFSKNHGLVYFYSMTNFPLNTDPYTLVGSSNPNMGIVNLTAAEIFDYDIGDEFHIERYYRSSFSPWQYEIIHIRRLVLNKVVSSNQDTLTYTIARCQNRYYNASMTPNPDTTITVDTITEIIILSQKDYLNQLSNEIRSDSSDYNTFLIDPQFNKRAKRVNNKYIRTSPTCWSEVVGSFPPYSSYIEGLGGGYYNNPYTFVGSDWYELVYYDKGGLIWGTPLNIDCSIGTSISEIADDPHKILTYPNPFSSHLNISIQNFISSETWSFELFDATGKTVRSKSITKDSFTVERKNLSKGIYFYHLQNRSTSLSYTGKVVLE